MSPLNNSPATLPSLGLRSSNKTLHAPTRHLFPTSSFFGLSSLYHLWTRSFYSRTPTSSFHHYYSALTNISTATSIFHRRRRQVQQMEEEDAESMMRHTTPNVCALVGRDVVARLMDIDGGLYTLAKMPAYNVELLGAEENLVGSPIATTTHLLAGYLVEAEVIQTTPPFFRIIVCRLLATKCSLAARVDSFRGDPSGKTGQDLLEDIRKKIEKWQRPLVHIKPKRKRKDTV